MCSGTSSEWQGGSSDHDYQQDQTLRQKIHHEEMICHEHRPNFSF